MWKSACVGDINYWISKCIFPFMSDLLLNNRIEFSLRQNNFKHQDKFTQTTWSYSTSNKTVRRGNLNMWFKYWYESQVTSGRHPKRAYYKLLLSIYTYIQLLWNYSLCFNKGTLQEHKETLNTPNHHRSKGSLSLKIPLMAKPSRAQLKPHGKNGLG